jgi:Zn-finger nucleic acid-binding protein
MKCPACNSPVIVVEYDAVELDHCPACEGTWFDAHELGLLFADSEDNPHPELVHEVIADRPEADTAESRRRCPACRRAMRKVNIGPARRVLVDVCPEGHGLWFDRGEVADLARDLELDPEHLPARVLAFVGAAFHGGRDAAADHD